MSKLKPCQSSVENAITVLENEKQCVLRQIQIGGCDRNCVKCDLVMKDSEILAGYDTAVAVLRRAQPDHSGDATEMPANEPLTLEQLREMDGEPVWAKHFAQTKFASAWIEVGEYGLVDAKLQRIVFMKSAPVMFEKYKRDFAIAYRRKPEGSENDV